MPHSPEPWGVVEENYGCKTIYSFKKVADDVDRSIFCLRTTEIGFTVGKASEEEDSNNASIIIASPTIYKALKAITTNPNHRKYLKAFDPKLLEQIDNAVKKAETEPKVIKLEDME